MEIGVKIIFSFQAVNYNFIIYTYITHIEACSTVLDDVTNLVMYRICNTN